MADGLLNVAWRRNDFQKFYALIKIRVGGDNSTDIQAGDEFEYDGSILKYAGAEYALPSFRGTFRRGWVSTEPVEYGQEVSIPRSSTSRNMAVSKSVNHDLAKVQRGGTQSIVSSSMDEHTVLRVGDRQAARIAGSHLTQADSRRGMPVESSSLDEGTPVGRVRTPAKLVVHDIMSSEGGSIANQLDNRVRGNSEFFGQTNIQKEGIDIRMNVGGVRSDVIQSDADAGSVVSRIAKRPSRSVEGIEIIDTSNIREERAAARAASVRQSSSQQAAPVPQKKPAYKVDTSLSANIRIARSIDPTFPADWSFSGKLADRLAAVKKHGAKPEFLEALYAAEGDQMRKALKKAYPKQF